MAPEQPRTLSAEAAVRRGLWTVNGPVGLAMFALPVAVGLVALALGADRTQALTAGGVAFPVGWVLAWLSWSILVPRWRLWAYERVDDLDELRRLAVQAQLLWPEGHVFQLTEIRPQGLREQLARLEAAHEARRKASAA